MSANITQGQVLGHHPLIVAHRGASASAKENTIAAFQQAIALGADWVEFDVRRTRDQVLVVVHDGYLQQQAIAELTYRQVQLIDPDIPTLEAVIQCCKGKIRLDVELKEVGSEAAALELLLQQLNLDDFVITSFQPATVRQLKHLCAAIPIGLLMDVKTLRQLGIQQATQLNELLHSLQVNFVAPNWQLATPDFCQQMALQSLPLWVWTVNQPEAMQRFFTTPSIAGVITDKPDVALHLRQSLGSI